MAQHDINAEKETGTADVTYNLVNVLYHALQGGENYALYARDAEQAGDRDLAQFFRQLVDEEQKRADQVKKRLKHRLQ